ncbi:DUF5915 domain-containing protein, partial [Natronoarchaeum mannanilyticum]|uniref:DUF5915 domain-containing protein n=1 Tax=Natronoarchaeum mannanilyticum TaxID=926360 RepID=UPI0036197428
ICHRDLLADRLNAREIQLVDPDDDWGELRYSAEADMSELGPAFGDRAGQVMNALNDARVDEPTLDALEVAVADVLEADDELTEEMVSFVTQTPDAVSGSAFSRNGDDLGVVYVDTELNEDIESEGYAREVIRRVQEMRKELDLEMDASIRLEIDVADDRVADLVREHEGLITQEVRAEELAAVEDGHRKTWDVEGTEMEIAIAPVVAAEASE